MNIYLAASYSRRLEMVEHAEELRRLGHTVVSSWISGKHEHNSEHGVQADELAEEDERQQWALEDIVDLIAADTLVAFTEDPGRVGRNRGGRHVELGFAIGWAEAAATFSIDDDKRVVVIGPRENIFHCLPYVEQYDAWEQFIAYLGDGRR